MICLPKKQFYSVTSLALAVILTIAVTSCQKSNLYGPGNRTQGGSILKNGHSPSVLSPAVQTPRAGVIVSQHIHGFYEYLPLGYANDTNRHPLLICMHGIGQVGNGTTDLPGLLLYGPAMMINNGTFPTSFSVDGKTYSMIIITPQLTDVGMYPIDIDSLIEYCKSNYRVDTNRLYLAGISFGGANVWHYAGFSAQTANKITAMVPIASWTTPDSNYQVTQQEAQTVAAANIRIWQTHCYNDPTASFSWSVTQGNMVINSVPAPSTLPKLTSFNSNSHDAWTTTYDPTFKESGLNIYQWMLHYCKGLPATALNLKPLFTQVVTLKGSNNLYMHNNGDGSPLYINSTSYTLWEGYIVVTVSANKVALQNQGSYITRVNPQSVSCTANSIGSNETFIWIYNSDGTVSFENNHKYLSNNNGNVTCLASTIGTNEKFWINR